VERYDVLEDGSHKSLTKTEIADLFRAGRLNRDHRCKLAEKKEWRTIDELFPLLKYDSTGPDYPLSEAYLPNSTLLFVLGGTLAALILSIAALLFWWNHKASITPAPIAESGPKMIASANVNLYEASPSTQNQSRTAIHNSSSVEGDRRARERQRIEQMTRERMTEVDQRSAETERRKRAEEQAAEVDYHIPLDQNYYVNMNGGGVSVRIHDNDVTSFDVWVDGMHHREVPKQKGITHSRTDETLIYNNGRSSLYYVWEISGELNHCLLRVRDN
jgi:hypothetical protein